MDLAAEAERLRLDLLAVELCAVLAAGSVEHVLLKGPSTANWLYDPPRPYRDVDVLVPASRLDAAATVIASAGLGQPKGGLPGEEADHSYLMRSVDGFEIDLHRSLPAVPVHADEVWDALIGHVEPLELGVGAVPALDEPARCLVLALHAVGNPAPTGQAAEDLRRARARATAPSWESASSLAGTLGVQDLFDAGIRVVEDDHRPARTTSRARLYAGGAPSGALALQRLSAAPRRDLPRLIARELVPSRGFMQQYSPTPITGRTGLLRAHLGRWQQLAHDMPAAIRAWRGARRLDAQPARTE